MKSFYLSRVITVDLSLHPGIIFCPFGCAHRRSSARAEQVFPATSHSRDEGQARRR